MKTDFLARIFLTPDVHLELRVLPEADWATAEVQVCDNEPITSFEVSAHELREAAGALAAAAEKVEANRGKLSLPFIHSREHLKRVPKTK